MEVASENSKVEYEFKTTAQYYNALRYSAQYVLEKLGEADVAVVLGSGLGGLVDTLTDPVSIEYTEVPFMPKTSVVGHGKTLYNGKIGDKRVLLWSGRVHMYEGYSSDKLTFITYLSAFVGCKYIILTNSSGGGLEGMKHGSIMVSKDHINFAAKCPIPATFNDKRFGERNPKSSLAHSDYLRELAKEVAKENDVELFEGNYTWTTGPCYETPLEVSVIRKFGGGCFGMSTVPEILAAGQIGLECVVLTMITNLAAGLQPKLSHHEVHNEAMKAGPRLAELVKNIIGHIDTERPTSVKLQDQISKEISLPSYLMKNPKPQYPINEWIAEAVEILHMTNLGHSKVDEAYWFMSYGAHRDILKNADLKDIREIGFEEIPNMPTKTSSAKHSKIIFASTTLGKRVLLVLNSFLEGLIPTEAMFMVNLLKALDISMIKFVVEAATTGKRENLKDGCFVVASDYISRSYFSPVDPKPNYFYPFKSIRRYLDKKFRNILCDNLGDDVSGFDDISLLLQDGPCYPSEANIEFYRLGGQDLITITNLTALDCANTYGMLQMTFVVVRDQDFVMHENPKAKEIAKTLFENFSNDSIAEEINFEADKVQIAKDHDEYESLNSALNLTGIDYAELNIPTHSNADSLNSCVSNIKAYLDLPEGLHLGILIHHLAYHQIAKHINVEKVVKFTADTRVAQKLPELIYGSFDGQPDRKILIMKGMIVHQELLDPTFRTMPTRILRNLGVDKFMIIGNVFAVDDEMNVGDIALPVDHINISVLNPTMGPNIDEWGRRFYDVSKCYNTDLVQKFEDIAAEKKIKTWKTHVAFTTNAKSYSGLSEKRLCDGLGTNNDVQVKVTSFQGFPELMAIRHMDFDDTFKTVYIGIVANKCTSEYDQSSSSDVPKVDSFDIENYSKGVEKAMEVFKDFIKIEELA